MKQVMMKGGGLIVEDVPAPEAQPGCILVQTSHSCISSGTELSQVRQRATPLWRKALNKPQQVKKAVQMARQEGILNTLNAIDQKLNSPAPLGYSAAGEVIAVGAGVEEFSIGDLVACAGSQAAFHAEINCVPANLAVKIPAAVSTADASSVALGAIALQGVRRLNPTLGETFVVFGLGILGQLSVQILRAGGCRVIAVDLDPSRVEMAKRLGAEAALTGRDEKLEAVCLSLTQGVGADGVLVTASGSSPQIMADSFHACRKKGRVVLVGDVPLDINRADLYEKELDFLISCSYGPGRYDKNFEERGIDYPLPYVRWTETRNMQAYLQLIAEGKVDLSDLLRDRFPIHEAVTAFEQISQRGAMTALIEYPARSGKLERRISIASNKTGNASNALRLALVGVGSFTKAMHAPILKKLGDSVKIKSVVARQGHSAKAAAELLGAESAGTDLNEMLKDPEVDAVFIATRHDLHAPFALQSLRAGKSVFLEKPMALSRESLNELRREAARVPGKTLFTGFNRRFSPAAVEIRRRLRDRKSPFMIQYTMNAGLLAKDHWVHGAEGGGRNLGEACHVYDLFCYWAGASAVAEVKAVSIHGPESMYGKSDNFSATIRFPDGSVATLIYTAMGNASFPKETATIFSDGRIFQLEDFKKLSLFESLSGTAREFSYQSKGHAEEWRAFLQIAQAKGIEDFDPNQQFLASEISFSVEEQIRPSATPERA